MHRRSVSDGHGPGAYDSFSNGNEGTAEVLADWYAGGDPLGRTLHHWWCM